MRLFLPFAVLLLILFQPAVSQTLWSDDFENYEMGNFPGGNGWIREGGEEDWVKIVQTNPEKGKSIQFNSPDENTSGIFVTHYNNWAERDPNKDILEVSFDLFTGQEIIEGIGMIVIATENFEEIVSIVYTTENNAISVYAENFDEILVPNPTPDTWYNLSMTYNSITGEIMVRVDEGPVLIGYGTAGMEPEVFDFTCIVESKIGIDNVSLAATDGSVSGIVKMNNSQLVKVFPNPVSDIAVLHSEKEISHIELLDAHGKKLNDFFGQTPSLDFRGLIAGNYFLRVSFADGFCQTQQIIKN
ncbi:MAG: T9SS type A sorting domain-containing protein [Bacteroidales bacterium]|nr:T9SS type A sorting domain-containing protein [Bacteroidales bacterium]